jgi:predicted TIM-barrel enzyme
MGKDVNEDRLAVIANLLAIQLTKDMSGIDATWLLKKSGMQNSDIAQVLDISEGSVRMNISKKKRQVENSVDKSTKTRVKKAK